MADFYEKLPENPTTPSGPRSWFEFSRWLSIVQRLLRSLTSAHWLDVFFPMSPPKTTGTGNPSLITWHGNLRGYHFAIGDTHDFDPQEFPHNGKSGTTAYLHVHFANIGTVAFDSYVRFRIEYSQANRGGGYSTPVTAEKEIRIPANTSLTYAEDLTSFTTISIASIMYVKLTRIASVGAAFTGTVLVGGVHYHYQADSQGSRGIFTK